MAALQWSVPANELESMHLSGVSSSGSHGGALWYIPLSFGRETVSRFTPHIDLNYVMATDSTAKESHKNLKRVLKASIKVGPKIHHRRQERSN